MASYLLVVCSFALELLDHVLLRDAIVVDDRLLVKVKPMQLASHRLEQRAAAGAGTTENNEKLATVENAVEVVEYRLGLLLAKAEQLADVQGCHQPAPDGALKLQGVTSTG